MIRLFPLRYAVWLAPLVAGLAACDTTGPGTRALSLSITTKSAGPAPSPSAPASGLSADLHVGSGANALTISKVQIVLSEIELSTTGTCGAETGDNEATGNSNDNHEENCDEMEFGPLVVDLPLDGTTKAILDAAVPAGSYSGLQAELEAVTPEDEGAITFLRDHTGFAGVSVMVSFTDATGVSHNFTSSVEAKIKVEFPTPVTVGTDTKNLTIEVDVASWFKDASGAVIDDPTNPANAEAINANIRKSFKAFGDDDHDGIDDDHEETIAQRPSRPSAAPDALTDGELAASASRSWDPAPASPATRSSSRDRAGTGSSPS